MNTFEKTFQPVCHPEAKPKDPGIHGILRLRLRMTTLVFIPLLFFASCSKDKKIVVATVDNEKITAYDLKGEMEMQRGKYDQSVIKKKANFEKFKRQSLDKLIEEKIFTAEAKKAGVKVTKEEEKDIDKMVGQFATLQDAKASRIGMNINPKTWGREQKRRLVIGKLIEKEVFGSIDIPEEKIKAYYQKHIKEFDTPLMYRASQMIFSSKDKADKAFAKLKEGKKFEKLAEEYSEGPEAKNGGDLGFFDPKDYPDVFARELGKMKVGETSELTKSEYGWHILRLTDKKPPQKISYEDAKASIIRSLKEEQSEPVFEKWAEALKKNAKVAINEEALKGVRLGNK